MKLQRGFALCAFALGRERNVAARDLHDSAACIRIVAFVNPFTGPGYSVPVLAQCF